MAYGDNTYVAANCQDPTLEKRYDCNDNDYFDVSPTSGGYLTNNWNSAENKFLVGNGN
jgi:hypothetical protein